MNTFFILIIGFFYLKYLFGLRVEVNGTGISPIISFFNKDRHDLLLERNRAEQKEKTKVTLSSEALPQDSPSGSTMEAKSIPESKKVTSPSLASNSVPPTVRTRNNYWTDFRGPRRDGRYDEMPLLAKWPVGGPTQLWLEPVGGGYASFVVADGVAYTIEQRRQKEVVAAYELLSGREIWTHSWEGEFRESMGGDGPRATPTWDGGRLYALGALGEFRCLEAATGKLVWGKNILSDNGAQNLQWGMAASPLIVDDKVVVLPGGPSGKSVVAYDKLTGQPVWKSLDDKQAYTSPMLVSLNGRRQILVVSAERALGLVPESGVLLWDFPWVTEYGINSAQPIIVGDNRFFISAGYGHGAALVEVSPTSNGFTARTVWQNNSMKNKFGSSVLYQRHVYGMDEAILTCLDVETGERKWKGGRYGYGQVILAGDQLVILSEYGGVAIVRATPDKYEELLGFPALEGKTWNHPAIAGGYLLVRNTTQMACFKVAY